MTHRPGHLRIAVLSQWYRPEPVPLPHDLARALVRRGHRVRVLTSFPTYPAGRVYPGFRQRLRQTEVIDAVPVTRVPVIPSHDRNPLARAATYLSFALTSVAGVRALRGADVVYVYATPLTAALAALVLRLTRGTPYVLHVQDLWPDSVTGSGMLPAGPIGRAVDRLTGALARALYRRAGAVVGISPRMAEILRERGAPPERTHAVYNWSPADDGAHRAPLRPDGDPVRFLYAGNVGGMQDLETLVEAAALAQTRAALRIDVVGDGTHEERIRALATRLAVTSIRFHGRVPAADVEPFYATADFSLVTLRDLPVFEATIPSKFQASLCRGLPVVTTVRGAVAEVCQDHGCGVASPPGDVQALADVLVRCARMPLEERARLAENARRVCDEVFGRDRALDALEGLLVEAAGDGRRADA